MKFGTKLKLKKDWRYGTLSFEKGSILLVAFYEHKYGLKLHYPRVSEIIDFLFDWNDREERINEYFEVLEDDGICELVEKLRTLDNTDSNYFLKHFQRGAESILKIRGIEIPATLAHKNINLAKAMKIIK